VKVPPETEPAMDGTPPTCYDDAPAPVLPQQTTTASGSGLVEWIGHEPGCLHTFGRPRQDLHQQGVLRIAGTDPSQPRVGNQQRETARSLFG
jgi:hypothetical protein